MDNEEKKQLLRLNAIMGISDEAEFQDEDGVHRDPITGRRTGQIDSDAGLHVSFDTEAVLDKGATFDQGTPIYRDVEFITIIPPGKIGKDLKVRSPVTEYYKWRFPIDYKRWKEGREQHISGTRLALLEDMSQARIKELEALNVFTLEQLVELSSSQGSVIRGLSSLQSKAKAYLANAKERGQEAALQAALAARDEEVDLLKNQLQSLLDRLDAEKAVKEDGDNEEPPVAVVRKTYKKAD